MKQIGNEAGFARLAQTYGSRIARWPVALRKPAGEYLNRQPQAAAALLVEAVLDAALDQYTVSRASPEYLTRLHDLPMAKRAEILTPFSPTKHWASGMALAASLVFGFLMGTSHLQVNTHATDWYLHTLVFGSSNVQGLVL